MKKDKLREIVLKDDYYDIGIYRLLDKEYLDPIIDKLDDINVVSNVNSKEVVTSEEQFIGLLNRFILFFKSEFLNIPHAYNYVFEELISNNIDLFTKYLTSKYYLGDNKYNIFFEDSINRLSVANFIKNCSYLDILKKFMIKNGFKIKSIEKYSTEEILAISKLVSNITYAYNNNFHLILLFEDVEGFIRKNEVPEKYKKTLLEGFIRKYEIIISEYNNKKDLIEELREFTTA